jgi:hypothetical protein
VTALQGPRQGIGARNVQQGFSQVQAWVHVDELTDQLEPEPRFPQDVLYTAQNTSTSCPSDFRADVIRLK